MAVATKAHSDQSQEPRILSVSPLWVQGLNRLGRLVLPSQAHEQAAASAAEQQELQPALQHRMSAAGGCLAQCAMHQPRNSRLLL